MTRTRLRPVKVRRHPRWQNLDDDGLPAWAESWADVRARQRLGKWVVWVRTDDGVNVGAWGATIEEAVSNAASGGRPAHARPEANAAAVLGGLIANMQAIGILG